MALFHCVAPIQRRAIRSGSTTLSSTIGCEDAGLLYNLVDNVSQSAYRKRNGTEQSPILVREVYENESWIMEKFNGLRWVGVGWLIGSAGVWPILYKSGCGRTMD